MTVWRKKAPALKQKQKRGAGKFQVHFSLRQRRRRRMAWVNEDEKSPRMKWKSFRFVHFSGISSIVKTERIQQTLNERQKRNDNGITQLFYPELSCCWMRESGGWNKERNETGLKITQFKTWIPLSLSRPSCSSRSYLAGKFFKRLLLKVLKLCHHQQRAMSTRTMTTDTRKTFRQKISFRFRSS